jgi:hypothetical protein
MIGFWVFALSKNIVPPEEKPWSIAFHVTAELSTAILLIFSGIGLWLGSEWARMLSQLGLGLLLYSVINSPGYYAQKKNLSMVAMFIVLIILTVAAIFAGFGFA